MTCLEARKRIDAYLNNRLNDEELAEFIKHIGECRECMEELEINYMIYSGVKKLDEVDADEDLPGELNITGDFHRMLDASRRRLWRRTALRVARCAADTAAFWSVLLIALMQFARWQF